MRRAFTFIEMVIYVALALIAALGVGALFKLGRGAGASTAASYLVSAEADTALRWLKRDLQETALISIRSYPSAAQPSQPPGVSMASARDTTVNNGALQISKYGTPLWNTTVFYSVNLAPGERTGELIRWEKPLSDAEKDFVPHPSDVMPNSVSGGDKSRRVLMHKVLIAPNTKVAKLLDGADFTSDASGGLQVQFVQRAGGEDGAESLTSLNPGDAGKGQKAENNTHLVNVRLQVLSDDRYNASFYEVNFRIHPRY